MKNSDIAQIMFHLNGSPFRIDPVDMRHLLPIYDGNSSSTLMMFGRQTHKSTTIGNRLMLPALTIPGYNNLYVAPTGKQVSVFSDDKLKGVSLDSPAVSEFFFDKRTKDQVFYKEFSNHSKIYLRSSFHSPDSARGISADGTCFDEMQDLIQDHIPVIEQSMAHSIAKYHHMKERFKHLPAHLFNNKTYAGTPKSLQNTLTVYWEKSTQCEWIIKCEHCSKHNYIDEANVGKTCLICRYCGKPIYYENGDYVAMNAGAPIAGYRVPQIIVNWVNDRNNPRSWQIQVNDVREVYSPEKFYNEVLALPYANARNPLSHADILGCCDQTWTNMTDGPDWNKLRHCTTFFGIDWGKGDQGYGTSYTQLFIGTFIDNRFRIVFAKKYTGKLSDPLLQIDDIVRLINEFKCGFGLADHGDGRVSNAQLVRALGPQRMAEIYESSSLGDKIKWNSDVGMYIMNRSQMMTDRFMEIKRHQVKWFGYDEFKEFAVDFLNIYIEYSDITRKTKYDHTGADDAFHAYMYCRIASMIANGELNKYLLGAPTSNSRASAVEVGTEL